MENCKNFKNEYEEISSCTEEGQSVFEFHFKKLAEVYHNFLTSYFISEGGVLTNEFRFVHARRKP